MGENAGFKIRLHNGDDLVGDMNIYPQRNLPFKGGDDLRISSFSTASDRCPPLVVLHTIASEGMSFKLKPLDDCDDSSEFAIMHSACLRELKVRNFSLYLFC
jgi:RNA polymerase II C-terminal domain phosphatase-like 1/2